MDGTEYLDAGELLMCPECGLIGDADDFAALLADGVSLGCLVEATEQDTDPVTLAAQIKRALESQARAQEKIAAEKRTEAGKPMSNQRKPTKRCPVCGGQPDGYTYEADPHELFRGFPETYRICEHCQCPLVEVGRGHGRADWKREGSP